MAKPPNILFIFADQLRGMDIGCAGNRQVATPNIDRLAQQGARFDHAFANAPVCGPSRACLLTGLYPLAHRVLVNDFPLPEEVPTVGDYFTTFGYRTGYVGKWHLDGLPRGKWTPPGPRRHGFDFWAGYNCSHDYFRPDKYFDENGQPLLVDGYEPEVQTDRAIDFLSQRYDRPFCLFLSWGPPHDPYRLVPSEFLEMYREEFLDLRPNVKGIGPEGQMLVDVASPREGLRYYYAAITALDRQLGRILSELSRHGMEDDTIVVFTSDHGDMLWSQGFVKKQLPWEESINIPLVMRWPGKIRAGTVNHCLISIVDMSPTLLGLAGCKVPLVMQGRDLSDSVVGEAGVAVDSVFIMDLVSAGESKVQGAPEWRGVRTMQHTFVRRMNPSANWLLYDNSVDPYQLKNLVGDPRYGSLQRELGHELDEWIVRAQDPCLAGTELIERLGLDGHWNARGGPGVLKRA